ncbi:MAG TPA: NFACT RNA binding domain-containing protein [Pseudoflavonifractor sp.]|nr:NFACT RNA binding domain-containing protein [Pseudoflavonifractor sp.]
MALDAICLSAVVEELRRTLVGGKIDKIYQPGRDEVILAARGAGKNVKLLLSANPSHPRLHLTEAVRENPAEPPMFCMLLRKHLTGARILELEQPSLERVVVFVLECLDELGDRVERKLVLEAMGRRANLILLDGEGRITDCLRRVDTDMSAQRQILPGMFYRLPEPRPGVPPLIGRELEFQGRAADLEAVYALEREIRAGGGRPFLLLRGGKSADFSFMPILQYGPDTELREYDTFSHLLDDFYATREDARRMGQKEQELLKLVTRARERTARRIAQQELELAATADRERKRELGDILTSNLHVMERGMGSIRLMDFYDAEGGQGDIKLDPLLTPQQNAARYYKEYNKAKTAQRVLTEQIEKGGRELGYLDSVLENITLAEGERDLQEIRQELIETGYLRRPAKAKGREKTVAGKPMEFRSSAGLRISVGKNNSQNDLLTTKLAGRGDIWLHTQRIHGSHVILWTGGEGPDVQSLTEAASLAAYFSQGREGRRVPVDYTPVRFVKKPAGTRPGMVVYTTYQTAVVDPDESLARRLRVK